MYIVEGTIGAGKSRFLHLLKKYIPESIALQEPMNNWQTNANGVSLLEHFYLDPHRWAYSFELFTLMNRVTQHIQDQHTKPILITERSVYSGFYCFARNSFAQGFLSELEWHLYQQWFTLLVPSKCLPPQGFIYVRVAPDIAFERIQTRNRPEEKTITLSYLRQISQRHDQFLIKKDGILPHLKRVPVLIIDNDQDIENNPRYLEELICNIRSFLIRTGSKLTDWQSKQPPSLSL